MIGIAAMAGAAVLVSYVFDGARLHTRLLVVKGHFSCRFRFFASKDSNPDVRGTSMYNSGFCHPGVLAVVYRVGICAKYFPPAGLGA